MSILLLGSGGQLGYELQRLLTGKIDLVALDIPDIDFTDLNELRSQVLHHRPDIIINAAAYTAVDAAETNPELAWQVNAEAPGVLAETARDIGSLIVHFSTDYVYDGTKGTPYVESDPPNPLNVYARSKLGGDEAVAAAGGAYLILRTSWLYSLRRDSFVAKVLAWARRQTELRVVTDQIGCPTYARDLALATVQLLQASARYSLEEFLDLHGVYHLAGSGYASRYEWAEAILALDPRREEQTVQKLLPALTEDFPTPAQRPLFTALDCSRAQEVFGVAMPPWQASLQAALQT